MPRIMLKREHTILGDIDVSVICYKDIRWVKVSMYQTVLRIQ